MKCTSVIKKGKIHYKCNCSEKWCDCPIISFDKESKSIPICCGIPMKRTK